MFPDTKVQRTNKVIWWRITRTCSSIKMQENEAVIRACLRFQNIGAQENITLTTIKEQKRGGPAFKWETLNREVVGDKQLQNNALLTTTVKLVVSVVDS